MFSAETPENIKPNRLWSAINSSSIFVPKHPETRNPQPVTLTICGNFILATSSTLCSVRSTQVARMLHQMEAYMAKAFRDEAVVDLPRVSNNKGHESLRWPEWGKSFQVFNLFAV